MIAGTVLQGTKLPMRVWFRAMHLLAQGKKGLSNIELGRRLGIRPMLPDGSSTTVLHGSAGGRSGPILACVQVMRTDFGRPSSSMRFRTATATLISVV